jgi:hypothetical protein
MLNGGQMDFSKYYRENLHLYFFITTFFIIRLLIKFRTLSAHIESLRRRAKKVIFK